MNTQSSALGRALAYVPAQPFIEAPTTTPQESSVKRILERYQQLKKEERFESILETLPQTSCPQDGPFLQDNEDFFLALYADNRQKDACVRLARHLNDCYHCFEIFSQVLRDLFHEQKELKQTTGTEKK